MKTLCIVRHAKSDWKQTGQKDTERGLLPRGVEKTKLILTFLRSKGIKPDLILSSHAVRAKETARLLADGLDYPEKKIKIDKCIYASHEEIILDLLTETDDSVDTLIIVGHNPEFTNLSNLFIDNPIEYLPTSGVVSVSFKTKHWEDIGKTPGIFNFFIYPKALE